MITISFNDLTDGLQRTVKSVRAPNATETHQAHVSQWPWRRRWRRVWTRLRVLAVEPDGGRLTR